MNNFNLIAPFYDQLAKLVFGTSLLESQIYFLSKIKATDSVLILGGGTGGLLEQIPKCQQVHFVDLSEKMINRAKKRDCQTFVVYTHADFLDYHFKSTYDVIICPFFFDCFDEAHLKEAILKAKSILKDNGKLIVTDFDVDQAHPLLIKIMHFFFRATTALESKKLQNIHRVILNLDFEEMEIKNLKNGIFTTIYK